MQQWVHLVDFVFMTTVYFTIGFVSGNLVESWMGPFRKEDYKRTSALVLFFEVLLHVVLFSLFAYGVRSIPISTVPFPFNGLAGYERSCYAKELLNTWAFSFAFLFSQNNLREKMAYMQSRLFANNSPGPIDVDIDDE